MVDTAQGGLGRSMGLCSVGLRGFASCSQLCQTPCVTFSKSLDLPLLQLPIYQMEVLLPLWAVQARNSVLYYLATLGGYCHIGCIEWETGPTKGNVRRLMREG